MTVLKWIVGIAGATLVAADLYDLVRALVVPRPHTTGPVAMAMRHVRSSMHAVVGRISSFSTRDQILTTLEPMVMLLRLGVWLVAGLVGFACLIWSVGTTSFGYSFIESGSSIFTLGFATENHPLRGGGLLAAAFGLLVVTLQIAYLPALYDSFNRRETLVTMLESRAGTPAWGPGAVGPSLPGRHRGQPGDFYGEWERWAADVAESHTTYPPLLYMRSPHPTNSWLVGLIAVCDSAALYLAVCPERRRRPRRRCVSAWVSPACRDIARAIRLPFDADPRPDADIELPYDDFVEALDRMAQAGVPLERSAEEAWPHFKGWRVNYESIAYALTNIVFAPPGAWTGPRRYPDDAAGSPAFPRRPVDRRPDQPEGDRVESV